MAVQFDAAADRLLRTANVIDRDANFTVMLWFYQDTAPGNGAYQTLWSSNDDGTSLDILDITRSGGSQNRLVIGIGASYSETLGGTTLNSNQWYHVSYVRRAGNDREAFLDGVSEVTHTQTSGGAAETRTELGGFGSSNIDPFPGRIAVIKIWSAALSDAELQSEMEVIRPIRFANLEYWSPCFPGATERLAEYSANRIWTAGGTLTDASGPPVSWGAPNWVIPFVAGAGPVTVNMSAATLASSAPNLTVVPGAVTRPMNAVTLASSAPSLTWTGQNTVAMDPLTLASSAPNLTVVPGAATVAMDPLTLASSPPNLTVSPGQVTTSMAAVTLASSPRNLTVVPGQYTASMGAVTLASSAPNLTVVPGGVTIAMDPLTLASSAPNLTVSLATIINMLAVTLASSAPSLSVVPGAVTIAMDPLTLAGSVPQITVSAPSGVQTILMDALTLASSAPNLTVTPGAVSIAMDPLTLASQAANLTWTGQYTASMSAVTLASSAPSLTVVPGATTITLDAITLASSAATLTISAPGLFSARFTLTLAARSNVKNVESRTRSRTPSPRSVTVTPEDWEGR